MHPIITQEDATAYAYVYQLNHNIRVPQCVLRAPLHIVVGASTDDQGTTKFTVTVLNPANDFHRPIAGRLLIRPWSEASCAEAILSVTRNAELLAQTRTNAVVAAEGAAAERRRTVAEEWQQQRHTGGTIRVGASAC